MKPITAMIAATLAGVATFVTQSELFPPRLHAAPFFVPNTADWRQQMIDHYPGGAKVDHVLGRLKEKLDLSQDQAREFRPLLQQQHDEVLALLLTAPPSLTRNQFLQRQETIWEGTRKKLDALLTPEQLELVRELPHPAKAELRPTLKQTNWATLEALWSES